jgi:chorismate mutase
MERCSTASHTNGLKQIFKDRRIRNISTDGEDFDIKIDNLRADIDIADSKLLEILGKRMKIAEQIGALKKEKNIAVLQNKRWNEILIKMILEGEDKELSEEFILRLFKAIHQESIAHQEKVFKSE